MVSACILHKAGKAEGMNAMGAPTSLSYQDCPR